ncbi:MAG: precorrin-6A reductase [Lachnospiraceae bacterium]|nr:precorrin-6A reductase [Lachnospiraceae bacterium]
MERILIFSGTTEGRKLAELLSGAGVPAVVCVATEYGEEVMKPLPDIVLHQGRMNQQEMREFMEGEAFLAIVDATHPFATQVSENIRQSAGEQSIPYLRLQRNTKTNLEDAGRLFYFATNEECQAALMQTEGNILLTTGSKELAVYCAGEELKARLYARVLPSEESIGLCKRQGLTGKQIIAMQGPFSEEMNKALISQYHIKYLVTKESGITGGFEEKVSAADKLGVGICVIGNPEKQEGLSFEEVCNKLEILAGMQIKGRRVLHISLIGMGMGNIDTLTVAAKERIEKADYLFGAKRLLKGVEEWGLGRAGKAVFQRISYPFYLSEDIIPALDDILLSDSIAETMVNSTEAVVLLSGDSGFYSGTQKLYQSLKEWKRDKNAEISIRIYPGISSVSYFAAACKESWQEAAVLSIHGKGNRKEWEAEVLSAVRYQKKVFLLVSGVKDVQAVGSMLKENGLSDCRIFLGYQLSYPEEEILECSAEQCEQIKREGLYILGIFREKCEKRYLAPKKRDEEFIRGKVPMTKEEIRELAICKLKLTEDAVVYDIGSGTGSVAVEIAEQSCSIRVYAIEQKEEGIALIQANREKFHLPNIEIIQGKAPDCLREFLEDSLPPTHAFIGGSGGNLKEILETLYQKNPSMRIVVTAVSLETVSEITELINSMPTEEEEIIQVQINRARKAGSYHLMQAENPIYICSFAFVPSGTV